MTSKKLVPNKLVPGEMIVEDGELILNANGKAIEIEVANTGDRPVQIGSHYHFFEVNTALSFDRDVTKGMRLDIAAGTAVRFEPGQKRSVRLISYSGHRQVFGFNQNIMGDV